MSKHPEESTAQRASKYGLKTTILGIAVNAALVVVKGLAGIFGHSFALIADAIESAADVFSSLIVYLGLKLAAKPADLNHPYGHGKFEPLATVAVGLALILASLLIARASFHNIFTPHTLPAPFTLVVLVIVIIVKESLFHIVHRVGRQIESSVVKADAWHHRSDAITSVAAFIGISIAIIGGPGFESADDFAALFAAGLITVNAVKLSLPAFRELLDTVPDPEIEAAVRRVAETVPGVLGTHHCFVRKVGFDHFVDLDVLCDPDLSLRTGHNIAHDVKDTVVRELPQVTNLFVHIEPVDDFGRGE